MATKSPPDMLAHERAAWAQGHPMVVGIDEVGRGPLAGPVTVAAVHFSPEALTDWETEWAGLTDSKKLNAKKREDFHRRLRRHPGVRIVVASANVREVDKLNILRATHLAMKRAAKKHPAGSFFLVDGRPVPGLPGKSESIVKGDFKSLSIAAASVVAKVTRDRLMKRLAKAFPAYGFETNMGYGTAAHLEALHEHGPCEHHRWSFEPVRQARLF